MVCHLLLVCVLACLHAALLQGVVVVEEVSEQVPQHTSMIQMGLQEEVHRKGAHTLDCYGSRFRETLKGRKGCQYQDEEQYLSMTKNPIPNQQNTTMILTFP